MEDLVILAVILLIVRFVARVKAAYVEAEQERLRTSNQARGKQGRSRNHGEIPGASSAARDERYYARVLGLAGNCGPDNVKRAYRLLVPQYHPDKVHHLGPKLKEVAEQQMKEINEAYAYFKRKQGMN